ncbi:Peptidase M14, carboxypeptidase A domain and Proteinase inhibitor, carboxypeptidase propeptide domain and ShKT domain and Proteinase inhibitor, propeptide domain-containing protein [Strongyloides ratti]|uniref:Peptidase M14, carboxypeptidase A domain and Proteinase inhibitor, carboxypeptidase propeptide domain and ShKT domain and Proteinase inhibitor, propeptide domain-containing protein n=1 Tax=Strongyloides ratti TaxID=34506 RepID=A0A090LJZ9_STRRB|nr:Peptidase M14, carboxypeptidase A domain and Proteinase inhibitor, carboxypeptidase propeptide domain and ShKT domain and Proteinase inhibitor, propeptide domain-containing protein [Strongyloides ratti]CEF68463.1 Peptidase M14, carboxypeptidase A domain and Proteinase inhibitor, carboxypeptidase propeptide domain and ShKT domain and Proteinase inhibitor, propeptide domain-containing protein [Strongyloides ratti]
MSKRRLFLFGTCFIVVKDNFNFAPSYFIHIVIFIFNWIKLLFINVLYNYLKLILDFEYIYMNSIRLLFFILSFLLYSYCNRFNYIKNDKKLEIISSNTWKVIRVFPENDKQQQFILELFKKSTELELNFWKAPYLYLDFSDIMVPPSKTFFINDLFIKNNISYITLINDVEKKIHEKERKSRLNVTLTGNNEVDSFLKSRLKDDIFKSFNKAKYSFGEYTDYNDIIRWLNDIEYHYPQISKVFTIGKTHEGRDIKGIKIGDPIENSNKRGVWIDGGMHAREWAAVHTALWFIEQLITKYNVDKQITDYVKTLNFYILPVANPDGFEYTKSDITPTVRLWRKNRGEEICKKDKWKRLKCCSGVDLNRNFDFHWAESGSSDDLCSDIYQGKSVFSEPESRAIRDKLLSSELYGKIDAFISLHTYSQMWIHPFNHQRHSFPYDINDLRKVGEAGVKAIEKVYGTKFKFGTGADILYPSAGGSDDWAKDKAKVKYVYLLELRPGEEEWEGFLLDRSQLIPTGKETWEGVKVVIDAVLEESKAKTISTNVNIGVSNQQVSQKISNNLSSRVKPQFVRLGNTQRVIGSVESNSNKPVNKILSTGVSLRTGLHRQVQEVRDRQLQARKLFEEKQKQRELQQRMFLEERRKLIEEKQRKEMEQRQFNERQNNLRQQINSFSTSQSQTVGCYDKSSWCSHWIQQAPSICQTSHIYMFRDCARSCNFC